LKIPRFVIDCGKRIVFWGAILDLDVGNYKLGIYIFEAYVTEVTFFWPINLEINKPNKT
tara:strand:+ start:51871 stop:52047 length:177 start_codon:yes stop_codon:yes gene_type:complete